MLAASCTQLLAASFCKRAGRGCDATPAPYRVLAQLLKWKHGSWISWELIGTSQASAMAHTKLPLGFCGLPANGVAGSAGRPCTGWSSTTGSAQPR